MENEHAKILWGLHIHTDKMVMENKPDVVLVDKAKGKAVVVDIAIPGDGGRQEERRMRS